MKSIDLRSSVRKAIELARQRIKKNGIAIDSTLPDKLPKVWGDEAALTEAFAHLLANAAEATSDRTKPRVTLAAREIRDGRQTRGVAVIVKDNGRGISAELKDKVFSPFCTTKARGIGLGLPIVKRTIFDHNGRVDIDSGPQGTAVTVMLPVSSNGH
jgi:C4-dicarboxylate-specific signal transduction histidine kinase